MKQTCNHCKALKISPGCDPSCLLGYPVDPVKYAPVENCPKPLTYLDFIEARNDMRLEAQDKG